MGNGHRHSVQSLSWGITITGTTPELSTARLPITVWRNRAIPLERGRSRIWVSGIDDALAGAADLGNALRPSSRQKPRSCSPTNPTSPTTPPASLVDLQLSGHSHGGQVRVPGMGALVLPAMAEKYSVGLKRAGALQVYTNRGLGVINPSIRFHCPPQVTLVTLSPAPAV
jgi:uncharacterized protein